MLKLIGSILIIGSCGTLGLSARERLHNRITAIDGFIKVFDFIESELAYRLTPLSEIFRQLTEMTDKKISVVFQGLDEKLEENDGMTFTYKWCHIIRDHAEMCCLKEEEISALCDAGTFLGRYDSAQQIRCIAGIRKRLERAREDAVLENRDKGSLYRTCGLALGLLAVLVLI